MEAWITRCNGTAVLISHLIGAVGLLLGLFGGCWVLSYATGSELRHATFLGSVPMAFPTSCGFLTTGLGFELTSWWMKRVEARSTNGFAAKRSSSA